MNNLIRITFLFFLLYSSANAQTNVSGGIYTNTTWTLANSPYIVVDTVVVFPNVTLTIQPGVVVKFNDNKRLEIRQGTLIAEGTLSDSITFTSNSNSPAEGIWGNIYIHNNNLSRFNYCIFKYAAEGIAAEALNPLSLIYIKNSRFENNQYGIFSNSIPFFYIDSCNFNNNTNGIELYDAIVNNCIFYNNQTGFKGHGVKVNDCSINNNEIGFHGVSGAALKNCIINSNSVKGIYLQQNNDTIYGCEIKYNGIGIENLYGVNLITKNTIEDNDVGIILPYYAGLGISMYCNKICNITYNLKYLETFGTNGNVQNNYWCTTDSLSIALKIYDGYDNVNYPLITFLPIDTTNCYQDGICSANFSLTPDLIPYHYTAVNMSIGTTPIDYTWDWGDGNFDYTAYPSHVYADTGTYTICLTINDTTGCIDSYCNTVSFKTEAQMVYVNVVPVGINNYPIKEGGILIYPNPVYDYITVESTGYNSQSTVKIINTLGQVVLNSIFNNQQPTLNISNLPDGFYHLLLEDAQGKIQMKKFVINR